MSNWKCCKYWLWCCYIMLVFTKLIGLWAWNVGILLHENYTSVKLFETCPLKKVGFLEFKSLNSLLCRYQLCDVRSVAYSLWNQYPVYKLQVIIFTSPFWGRNNWNHVSESAPCKLFHQYHHRTFSALELYAFCNVCTFKAFEVIMQLHTPYCISTPQYLLHIDPGLAWHSLCFAGFDMNAFTNELLQLISVPRSSHAGLFEQSWIHSLH